MLGDPPKLDEARNEELQGNLAKAVKLYEEVIREGYDRTPIPYERLMVIYRKDKKFKDELRIIKKGIKAFSDKDERVKKQNLRGRTNQRKLKELSGLFMQKTGLIDKKGKSAVIPEPIGKWMKRMEVVRGKMGE